MTKNKYIFYGIFALVIIGIIFIASCIQQTNNKNQALSTGEKLEGEDCRSDNECASGVCNFIKQDWGKCTPIACTADSQAQGISDISFFCNQNNQWQKIKNIGESCNFDYECFKRTGKDCPTCHPEDYKYYCKNNICVEEKQLNECEQQGLKRILRKDQYQYELNGEDVCIESMAQMVLPTTCAPCGDGTCNAEIETRCNCPEDCK